MISPLHTVRLNPYNVEEICSRTPISLAISFSLSSGSWLIPLPEHISIDPPHGPEGIDNKTYFRKTRCHCGSAVVMPQLKRGVRYVKWLEAFGGLLPPQEICAVEDAIPDSWQLAWLSIQVRAICPATAINIALPVASLEAAQPHQRFHQLFNGLFRIEPIR
jgi:hypothetical protein